MSNLWFNIRFGVYHWQWGPSGMNIFRNLVQDEFKLQGWIPTKDGSRVKWRWLQVYCLFGKHYEN